MGTLQQKLPDVRPGPFIFGFWLLSLATAAMEGNSAIAAIGSIFAAMLWWGYPYAAALSVPAEDIRPGVRRAAQIMGIGFVAFLSAVAVILAVVMRPDYQPVDVTFEQQPVLAAAYMLIALFGNVVVFGAIFMSGPISSLRGSGRTR